ncbi:MAG: sugar kinase [Dictyoglomaceae bacterium]|nr:sugar kinase [Dictyoglomaceae bacterium]
METKNNLDVLCVGIAVADILGKPIEFLPEKGKLILIDEINLNTGGCAVNTGIALAKLGFKVGVIARVGKDGFGDFIISQLKTYGIDTSGIKIDKNLKTSATIVAISKEGERSFWHYLGANSNLGLEDISEDFLRKIKILHIAGTNVLPSLDGRPTGILLEKAKKNGLVTSLDTVWDAKGNWLKNLDSALPYLDYFLPSLEEAKVMSKKENPEDIAKFFLDKGVKVVALKMGERGSYVTNGKEEYYIPIFPVEVKDTTGAGDAYVAGFLAGVLLGWNIKRCGLLGNLIGAFCVKEIGASAGIPPIDEVFRILKEKNDF